VAVLVNDVLVTLHCAASRSSDNDLQTKLCITGSGHCWNSTRVRCTRRGLQLQLNLVLRRCVRCVDPVQDCSLPEVVPYPCIVRLLLAACRIIHAAAGGGNPAVRC
jgi:hypothetical protein